MKRRMFIFDVAIGAIDKKSGHRYSNQKQLTIVASCFEKAEAAARRKLGNRKDEQDFIEAIVERDEVDILAK